MVVMYFIPGNSAGNHFENALDAMVQVGNSSVLMACFFSIIVTIAFFNYCGVSITKYMGATSRMMVDSVRTLVIYIVALAVGWEKFQYLQPIGFTLLVVGFAIFYGLIPLGPSCPHTDPVLAPTAEESEPLTQGDHDSR